MIAVLVLLIIANYLIVVTDKDSHSGENNTCTLAIVVLSNHFVAELFCVTCFEIK